jgi:hypothetical protein
MSQCPTTLCRPIWPNVYFVPLVSIRILNSLKFSTKRPRLFTQTDQATWFSSHVPHFWEVRALNLHRDTGHPDWGLSWLFSVRLGNWRAIVSVRAQMHARYEVFADLFRRIQIFFPNSHRFIIVRLSSYHSFETSVQRYYIIWCNNVLCKSLKTYKQHVQLPFLPTGLADWRPAVTLLLLFTAHLPLVPPLQWAMQNVWDERYLMLHHARYFTLAWTILMPYHTVRNVSNDRL